MRKPVHVLLVVLSTVALASVAHAQDTPKKNYEFVSDFSLAASQGNQEVTTLALGERYSYKFPIWKLSQTASVLRGTANGVKNAELYQGGLRGDYSLTKRLTAYVNTSGLRNTPAGLSSQTQQGAGFAYQVLDRETDKLQLSAGMGALQRSFIGISDRENDLVGSVDGLFRHAFTKVAFFEQAATWTPNFTTSSAWLFTSKSALVAPLSSKIGMKVGYLINFNNAPPLLPKVGTTPQTVRFKKFDGLLTTGLQFTY